MKPVIGGSATRKSNVFGMSDHNGREILSNPQTCLRGPSGNFYGIRDDSIRQNTWLCLGRVVPKKPSIKLDFLAREPDLMGEYFVLETLDKDVALEGKDASKILHDAWKINKFDLLDFMIRLIQDFKEPPGDHLPGET